MKTRFKLSCSLSLLKNQSPSQVTQTIKEKKQRKKNDENFQSAITCSELTIETLE